MKERTFKITIDQEGNFTVKTGEETKGEVCNNQHQLIRNILGGTVVNEGYTDEYYEDEGNPVNIENIIND